MCYDVMFTHAHRRRGGSFSWCGLWYVLNVTMLHVTMLCSLTLIVGEVEAEEVGTDALGLGDYSSFLPIVFQETLFSEKQFFRKQIAIITIILSTNYDSIIIDISE